MESLGCVTTALSLEKLWSSWRTLSSQPGLERGGDLAEGLGLQETSPRVSSFLPFLLEMQMASREESFQRMKAVFKKTLISSLTSF